MTDYESIAKNEQQHKFFISKIVSEIGKFEQNFKKIMQIFKPKFTQNTNILDKFTKKNEKTM